MVLRGVPRHNRLSEGCKLCDAAVYGVDVPADRPYLRTLFLDFPYPGTVKEQYGSHAADDCHKDDIAEKYLMLYIHKQSLLQYDIIIVT